ncbi:MAG: MFS transporter [Armatimonadetes bacterium]|nr:MFS transporter [Armatimonadota bacterium]
MISRLRQASPQLLLYFLAVAFMGIASGCFHTSYNNYLDEVFHIGAQARGMLEFPRELPGFLVAAFTGALAFLPETRVAGLCGLVTFGGMLGLGGVHLHATQRYAWEWMVFFTILWAIGTHVVMPVQSAIGMSLAHQTRHGRRLGQVSGLGAAATIIGAAFAWVTSAGRISPPYWLIFGAGGVMALCGGLTFLSIREIGRQTARPRLVYNRKYWLYYVLCLLFGARKQLFITFGPWVLIKVFHRSVITFAKLGIVNAVLTVFTNPGIGNLIDRWGERKILMIDSLILMLVCLGYGGAHLLGPNGVYLAFACFVLDQVMFGVGNARTTYLAKIAEKPTDVTASLSLGVTLDHAVSMSLPTLGGLIWIKYGHPWVFVGGGAIAVFMILFSSLIRIPPRAEPAA